uniref:Uncharacterized protein n=1 Tax=Aegilops tauschii TaxID=37682 RepID=M8AZ89_AEGTA
MGDLSYLESFCGLLCLQFFRTLFSLPRDRSGKRERALRSKGQTLWPKGNEQQNDKTRCPGHPGLIESLRSYSKLIDHKDPIPSLVDSMIPWESYKRITYPIPANDPIQFVYLFRHSIMKTVILEQNAISREAQSLRVTLSTGKSAGGMRSACYSTSSSSPIDEEENRAKALLEMRKKYPSGDGADADANARKAVLQAISKNTFFFVELITRFGPIDSESDRGVAGSHLAFAHRIEEILEFNGKSSGSMKDLDPKLDLEDASKREEILLPYFSSKKEAKS